jgi:hypothetical protein
MRSKEELRQPSKLDGEFGRGQSRSWHGSSPRSYHVSSGRGYDRHVTATAESVPPFTTSPSGLPCGEILLNALFPDALAVASPLTIEATPLPITSSPFPLTSAAGPRFDSGFDPSLLDALAVESTLTVEARPSQSRLHPSIFTPFHLTCNQFYFGSEFDTSQLIRFCRFSSTVQHVNRSRPLRLPSVPCPLRIQPHCPHRIPCRRLTLPYQLIKPYQPRHRPGLDRWGCTPGSPTTPRAIPAVGIDSAYLSHGLSVRCSLP